MFLSKLSSRGSPKVRTRLSLQALDERALPDAGTVLPPPSGDPGQTPPPATAFDDGRLETAITNLIQAGGTHAFLSQLATGQAGLTDLNSLYANANGLPSTTFPDGEQFVGWAQANVSTIEPNAGPNTGPLSPFELRYMRQLLQQQARGTPPLTQSQKAELDGYMQRFQANPPTSPSQEQLKELKKLLENLNEAIDKANGPTPVAKVLEIYGDVTGVISGLVDSAQEAEYQKFKQQMDGRGGNSVQGQFDEISGGFRPDWVDGFLLRYMIEQAKKKAAQKIGPVSE